MKTEHLKMDQSGTFQANRRQVIRLSATQLDATEQTPAVWAAVLGGAGLGLLWGSVARIWMRLISTQPEFSIPGTAAILIIATLFGTFVGLAFAARRRGWRRWGHYVPRSLVVIFFIPFGMAGGLPLMLTVFLATLGVVQRAVVGLWTLTALVMLAFVGTDLGLPAWAVGLTLAGAVALTAWKWIARRWRDGHRLQRIDIWLERMVRALLVLLAMGGFGFVAQQVLTDKPGLLAPLYILFYLILLYLLFLALRVGLEPASHA